MRKYLLIVIAVLVTLISCEPKHYNYNKVIAQDYQILAEQFDSVGFLEAQGKFKEVLSTEVKPEISWIMTVWNLGKGTATIEHPEESYSSAPIIKIYKAPWGGTSISNFHVNLSIEDAIDIVRVSEYGSPNSAFFNLRLPLIPDQPRNSQYIFGNPDRGMIWVDSMTGEISLRSITEKSE